jgi:hypothetical protein
MAAAKQNLVIEDNGEKTRVFVWKNAQGRPINLAGYSVRIQGRVTKESPTHLFDYSLASGHATIDASKGRIEVRFDQAAINAIKAVGNSCFYDIVMTPQQGDPVRLMEGKIQISVGVTR